MTRTTVSIFLEIHPNNEFSFALLHWLTEETYCTILYLRIHKLTKQIIRRTMMRRKRNKEDMMRMMLIFNKMEKTRNGSHQ